MKQFEIFGWLIRVRFSREGFWIVDKANYKNFLYTGYLVTSSDDLVARRVIFFPLMLEWGRLVK